LRDFDPCRPPLARWAGMVMLRMTANSRNAGPHSLVCLLSSFQRPSTTPRAEKTALEPSLERRGSREDNRSLQGGRLLHRAAPCRQGMFERWRSDRLSTRGRGCLHPLLPPVKPSRRPRCRSGADGTPLLPLRPAAVKPAPALPIEAGRAGASTPAVSVEIAGIPTGCRSLCGGPLPRRPTGQAGQPDTSTRERRHASAIREARSSRVPARRPRSCAAIASICRSALPISSFTTT